MHVVPSSQLLKQRQRQSVCSKQMNYRNESYYILRTYYAHITDKQGGFASFRIKPYEFNFLSFVIKLFVIRTWKFNCVSFDEGLKDLKRCLSS